MIRSTLRSLVLVSAVAAVLGACSASAAAPGIATLESSAPDAATEASPSPTAVDREAAIAAFTDCLREHGIDIDVEAGSGGDGPRIRIGGGPGGGDAGAATPDGPDAQAFQEAQEACRPLLANVIGNERPELTTEQKDAILAFTQCLRDHGIDVADPQFDAGGGFGFGFGGGGGGGGGQDGPAFDPRSEEFQAAQEACRPLMKDAFNFGGDGGPGGGGFGFGGGPGTAPGDDQ